MDSPDDAKLGPQLSALVATAVHLADRAVVSDVECEGQRDWMDADPRGPLYDISSMFNENEHSPQFIDMAQQGIAYGVVRGLLELLPADESRPRLVRVRVLRSVH
jgi:hypothetical protein